MEKKSTGEDTRWPGGEDKPPLYSNETCRRFKKILDPSR